MSKLWKLSFIRATVLITVASVINLLLWCGAVMISDLIEERAPGSKAVLGDDFAAIPTFGDLVFDVVFFIISIIFAAIVLYMTDVFLTKRGGR